MVLAADERDYARKLSRDQRSRPHTRGAPFRYPKVSVLVAQTGTLELLALQENIQQGLGLKSIRQIFQTGQFRQAP